MQEKTNKKPLIIGIISIILLVAIDLASKWLIQNNLEVNETITVIPNFFYITKIYNTKAAFSIGFDSIWGRILGIAISLLMSVFFVIYYVKCNEKMNRFLRAVVILMSSGAIGNLIDRSFYWKNIVGFDGVIDFMEFYLAGGPSKAQTSLISLNPFPIWNFADACLVIGVILFIAEIVIEAIRDKKKGK